ncbi:GIY-YIG nuclease family protein [Salinimicrobium catena]|uniref:GIY-YIG nuclease family protein n=1 Tax=Salinimicrobium catena TaxID=390640 RepID=UPI002FE4F00E
MHFLYIIYSQAADRFYTGETTDLEKRLREHNSHRHRKGFSKMAEDWKIVLKLEVEEKEKAVFLERYIKKMKSRKFIEKVIENPEILNDILKYK